MAHPFQCECGRVRGELEAPRRGLRAVCYCGDCQTYAHLLGAPQRVLDALGGTEVIATQSRYVRFTAGREALACLSLSPRGLLRWYAGCCRTPVANTPRDWKLPYVGVVHSCLQQPLPIERVQMHVNTQHAKGKPPGGALPGLPAFAALVLRLSGARLTGGYRQTPFFDAAGQPVAAVEVQPRERVMAARAAALGTAG